MAPKPIEMEHVNHAFDLFRRHSGGNERLKNAFGFAVDAFKEQKHKNPFIGMRQRIRSRFEEMNVRHLQEDKDAMRANAKLAQGPDPEAQEMLDNSMRMKDIISNTKTEMTDAMALPTHAKAIHDMAVELTSIYTSGKTHDEIRDDEHKALSSLVKPKEIKMINDVADAAKWDMAKKIISQHVLVDAHVNAMERRYLEHQGDATCDVLKEVLMDKYSTMSEAELEKKVSKWDRESSDVKGLTLTAIRSRVMMNAVNGVLRAKKIKGTSVGYREPAAAGAVSS